MRKSLRLILIITGLVVFLAAVGFVAWGETPANPMPDALASLQSDNQVTVTQGKWLVFMPAETAPTTGLVFYPGGRVDYRAYAPAARQIAAAGYLVVIPRMPLNLAVLDANAAEKVMSAYPQIQHWAVGGHSLGGAMAASFTQSHLEKVDGLVLWAAYPAGNNDLSGKDLQVVSISGSVDGLASPEKISASKPLLPPDTRWVVIAGGDHAQFGWYGSQTGDNPASISREEQQNQTISATTALLQSLQ